MTIDQFRQDDIEPFLSLAVSEGWICDPWELAFHLQTFPQGCFTARRGGAPLAFVTSFRHDRSGWIGNLVVRREMRGNGIGPALMERAMGSLQAAGVETVWLTASEAGKRLYERIGFKGAGAIRRWVGRGAGSAGKQRKGSSLQPILSMDRLCWGDARERLLTALLERGNSWCADAGFLITQAGVDGLQIGPWGCMDEETASGLLALALATAGNGKRVFLDLPEANAAAERILRRHGFKIKGSTGLMYLGATPAFEADRIYALASMGSFG